VISAEPLVQSGDIVVGHGDGMPTWLALLVVSQKSSNAALDLVLKLDNEMAVEIQSQSGNTQKSARASSMVC